MGSGVAKAIYTKWPDVRKEYIEWYERKKVKPFDLGENQYINVRDDVVVVNMVAQKLGSDVIDYKNIPPIRLWALKECLMRLADFCHELSHHKDFTITAPKFGSLRAGGDFDKDIFPMVEKYLGKFNVVIFEYEEK